MVLQKLKDRLGRLQLIWADAGYAGQLIGWAHQLGGWGLQIVKRCELQHCQVLPRRWVVERTFARMGRQRRLSKDYEVLPATSEALIYLAMIYLNWDFPYSLLLRLTFSVSCTDSCCCGSFS